MDIDQVRELIQTGEGQTIEFKASFASEDASIETLAAFASQQGGTVIFGVADNGSVRGVSLGKNTLENFANKMLRVTQPHLAADLGTHDIDGRKVVTATVQATGRYFRVNDKYFRRVGKTTVQIKPEDLIDELAALSRQGQSRTVESEKLPQLDLILRREGDDIPKGGIPHAVATLLIQNTGSASTSDFMVQLQLPFLPPNISEPVGLGRPIRPIIGTERDGPYWRHWKYWTDGSGTPWITFVNMGAYNLFPGPEIALCQLVLPLAWYGYPDQLTQKTYDCTFAIHYSVNLSKEGSLQLSLYDLVQGRY